MNLQGMKIFKMKKKIWHFIISIFYLFHTTVLFSQQQPKLRFHKIQDELLQGAEIERFFVTKDGCLWFGTTRGLASFDGSEMVYYGNKGLSSVPNFRVKDLVEDKDGNLWIVSTEHGVIYFNRKTGLFKKPGIAINKQIQSSQIVFAKICIAKNGILWIGTWYRGFFMYDPFTNKCSHYSLNPDMPEEWESKYQNSVRNIIEDKNDSNIIWLACYGNGIYSFNKKTKALSKKFHCFQSMDSMQPANTITDLKQINDSIIWFSTWGHGICEYNKNTGMYRPYQRNTGYRIYVYGNGHILEHIAQKSDSEFYVAPRDTIPAIFNIYTKKFYFINDDELNKEFQRTQNVKTWSNDIVYYEKGGALFIASPRFKLFESISAGDKKNFVWPEITCLLFDKNTENYFAGILLGEGVNVYDKDFNLLRKIPMPPYTGNGIPATTSIGKLHRDRAGHLWALGHITCVYDSSNNRFIPVSKKWPRLKLVASSMSDVSEDEAGILYFLSMDDDLIEFNCFTLEEKKISLPPGATAKAHLSYNKTVLFDAKGKYVYFTNNNNFYQCNTLNKEFRRFVVDSTFYTNQSSQFLSSYVVDSDGFIWMSTPDHYLWKISPGSFKIIDTVKFNDTQIDLNGAQLYGAYNEYLLISTLKSQLLFNSKNHECIYLNRNNGLLLNQGRTNIFCNDRVFFDYSGSGITQYASIESLLQPATKIAPYITFINVNDRPLVNDTLVPYLKKLALDYTHNTVAIGFSAIDLEFPERLEYAYKLKNTDIEWNYTNNLNRSIIYANLSPGKYVFKVKVREWGLDWSPETSLNIIIMPPFWQTWWFITLSILFLAAILFWMIQGRIKTIRRQEKLRSRHEKELLELEAKALRAQMNPHFIFNCMNSIKSLIQQDDQDKAITYLVTFSKLIRTIFENSDKREISLHDEIETCRLYVQLESLRFGNKFSYNFNIAENLDLKSIKVPALIIQPFIENAIWHGIMPKEEGGIVTITVDRTDHTIRCVINDNGIGRAMSKQIKSQLGLSKHQSKGVHLTQARLKLDNLLTERKASVNIIDNKKEDEKTSGTTVILGFEEY